MQQAAGEEYIINIFPITCELQLHRENFSI